MIGISHRCAPAGQSIESFLGNCREIGYAGVEHLWHPTQAAPRPGASFYTQLDLLPLAVRCEADPGQAQLAADFDSPPGKSARQRILSVCSAARQLGCRQVLIDPGQVTFDGAKTLVAQVHAGKPEAAAELAERRTAVRDRFLENICRNLHQVLRQEREVQLALVPVLDPLTLPLPEDLEMLLADLPDSRLGYWHAPDICAALQALGMGPAEHWIDAGRHRLAGCYLSDHLDGTLELLPGTGSIDWKSLASYLSARDVLILRVQPGRTRQEFVVTKQFLQGLGWT